MTDYWLPANLHERGVELADVIVSRVGTDIVGPADYWIEMPERVVDEPTRPQPATSWGDGFICLDLGPDDKDTWTRFEALAETDHDPESVARRAQVWRLPVTPYRKSPTPLPPHDLGYCSRTIDSKSLTVIDLTSMWAGPLCTELLARSGARVIKIEPSCRPDGLRYGDGDNGLGQAPMFKELNKSKEIADIDLRYCSEGGEFHRLLRAADLIVTSLSPRANMNLGITPEQLRSINPDIAVLTITAFTSASDESDWVAYGTGVHATSGYGWQMGRPVTPAFSYPDPLAGLEACAVALGQMMRDLPQVCRISLDKSVAALECTP
ncbi:MAG TPA: hypothetical protein DCX77_02730 [Acidimicrobiaceae bacterium]|nr:hypothetical protein [Acidimicrobiaceae bacterium]HAX04567.1 hypothetical protein [Acidimicrobiaceae bacterium]